MERSKGKDHASGLGGAASLAWRVPGAAQTYKTILTWMRRRQRRGVASVGGEATKGILRAPDPHPVPYGVVDPGLLMGGGSVFQTELSRPAPPLPAPRPHPTTHLNWAGSLHSSTLGRRVRHSSLVCATFSGHSLAMMDLSSSMMVSSVWKISCSVCGERLRCREGA